MKVVLGPGAKCGCAEGCCDLCCPDGVVDIDPAAESTTVDTFEVDFEEEDDE